LSPEQAKPNRNAETKRQAASKKAAARRRSTTAQRRAMDSKTNRVASELERFQTRASDLRSKAERAVERVKRLV
jgi:dynactin complex subunit